MKVHAVEPGVDAAALLAGAQFIDAYSIAIEHAEFDARQAAENMLGRRPRWIETLITLRNRGALWPEDAPPDDEAFRRRRLDISDRERSTGPPRRGL
jgi:hypothetical protein